MLIFDFFQFVEKYKKVSIFLFLKNKNKLSSIKIAHKTFKEIKDSSLPLNSDHIISTLNKSSIFILFIFYAIIYIIIFSILNSLRINIWNYFTPTLITEALLYLFLNGNKFYIIAQIANKQQTNYFYEQVEKININYLKQFSSRKNKYRLLKTISLIKMKNIQHIDWIL